MNEFISVAAPGGQVHLAVRPVTVGEYKLFILETGRAMSQRLKQVQSSSAPVINVSQVDAVAYCEWIGSRAGRAHRLPRVAELQELMGGKPNAAPDAGTWPHERGHVTELRGGMRPVYLCEWTSDTVEGPQYGNRPPRVLADIFYPPWLRDGNNVGHVHASLSVSDGYAFVTFRLAYSG